MDKNTRNMLIVFGVVVVALVALAFIGNLLSQILPLTIALVVGIVLGRLSVNVNLADVARKAISQRQTRKASPQAAKPKAAAKPAAQAEPDATQQLEARRQRIADAEPAPAEAKPELNDFEIKSEADILAETREREAEIRQKQASADAVQAALEERRRRLLSGQEGGDS